MRALSGSRVEREPVRLVNETVRLSVWAVLGAWLARRLWRLLVAILRSPALLAVLTLITVVLIVWHAFGPVPLVAAAVLCVAGLVGWRLRWPGSFDQWVYCTWRSGWRSGLIYHWRWSQAMTGAGLAVRRRDTEYLPGARPGPLHAFSGPGAGADAARADT